MILRLTAILLLAISMGCAKEESRSKGVTAHSQHQQYYEGELTSLYEYLNTSPYALNCDQRQRDIRLEVARALDERANAIAAYEPPKPQTDAELRKASAEEEKRKKAFEALKPEYIKAGPAYFIKFHNPPKLSDWESAYYGWPYVIELYEIIKSTAVDAQFGQYWQALNYWVRATAPDDARRLAYGFSMALSRKSGSVFKHAITAIENCLKTARCTRPDFNHGSLNLVYSHPAHKELAKSARWQDLNALLKLEYDRSFGFIKNEGISRRDRGSLILPMNIGAFAGAEAVFEQILREFWSSPDLSIEIDWINHSLSDLISYTLKHYPKSSDRSYVSREEHTVNLTSTAKNVSVVAHELGHVLGFPDRYFTSFNPSTCLYIQEQNQADLMSNSEFGPAALAEDLKTLDEMYPLN